MTLFNVLLTIHVIGGLSSLLIGTYIIATKKGDKPHKRLGLIYFYAMLSSAIVSLPMAYLHPNYFLFLIGIFTSYMLLTGKRYLTKKKLEDVNTTDWILTATILGFALAFICFGAYHLLSKNAFGLVFIVFGFIGSVFSYQDYHNFKGKSKIKNYWLTTHIQRMMGSYIASVTAFLVVNNTFLPSVFAWLLPTAILTPLILKWVKQYKKS